MERPRAPIALALLVVTALTGALACGRPPAGKGPPPDLTAPHVDEAVGEEAVEEMAPQLGLVTDEALLAYVDEIGQRLARNAPGYRFDYTFHIVDQQEPNAFALPGGFIFLSRGALLFSNTEDELAGVIGHEIAHVASRHAAAQQQVAARSRFLQFLQQPWLVAYSRDLERTADRMGQGLAAVSGYDPAGIVGFLRALDGLERITTGTFRVTTFYATHPGTRERAAEAGQRAGSIQWTRTPGVSSSAADHLRRMKNLVVGESGAEGVFDGTRFLHPDMGFTIRFPDGWSTLNTPAAAGAIAPTRDAQSFVEHGGPGNNAAQAAEKWIGENHEHHVRIDRSEAVRLAGRDAWRVVGGVRAQGVPLTMVVTFIPWRGQILRVVGIASKARFETLFRNVARSFRPMTPALLAKVKEKRVRIAVATGNETLSGLSRRTQNAMPLLHTAVMNGLRGDPMLDEGQLVKIAVEVPYVPVKTRPADRSDAPPAGANK